MAGETGQSRLRGIGLKAVKIESIPEKRPFVFKPAGLKHGKGPVFL
jgi:hypothetical protein